MCNAKCRAFQICPSTPRMCLNTYKSQIGGNGDLNCHYCGADSKRKNKKRRRRIDSICTGNVLIIKHDCTLGEKSTLIHSHSHKHTFRKFKRMFIEFINWYAKRLCAIRCHHFQLQPFPYQSHCQTYNSIVREKKRWESPCYNINVFKS